MSSFEALFSGVNFKNTIQRYCREIGWKIAEVDDKKAILKFSMDSGTNQVLFIIRYETTLEFSVPSIAAFNSEDRIPHYLSTLLLKRNSEKKIGFWCIEEIGAKHVFSFMHNAELQLINTEYFRDVVRTLINECERFEKILSDMINQR